jgi:hypothetical protein
MSLYPRQKWRALRAPLLPVLLAGLVALSGSLFGASGPCVDREAGRSVEGIQPIATAPTATVPTRKSPSAVTVLRAAAPTPQCGSGAASIGGPSGATVRPVRFLNDVLQPRDAPARPGTALAQAHLHAHRAALVPAPPPRSRPADAPPAHASMGPRRSVVLRV